MRQLLRVTAMVAILALLGTQETRVAPGSGTATLWMADDSHAARIARIERIPAVTIEDEAPIGLTLAEWMALHRIPGLSVAVIDGHRLAWAKTYGVREAGRPEPVTLDTLFQAGSISKPVAAMAVLHHLQAGRWTLDENINDKLISWKLPDNEFTKDQKATLRRLLSHSAGTTVHGFPGYAVTEPVPTLAQVLDGEKPANTAAVRVDLVPGSRTRYSGGGTSIVQLMMVDQLKKPFPQIMREAVIDPLGLEHSTYEQPLPPARAAMAASGTRASGKVVEGRWHIYPEMAAAGLWTTASDLARIAIEVSNAKAGRSARVLSQATTKLMLTKQSDSFGIGFAVDADSDRFGHNGADEGFQAYLTAFADSGRGIVIMANSDSGFMIFDRLAASVAAEYKWSAPSVPPPSLFAKLGLLAQVKGADRAVAWYKARRAEAGGTGFGPAELNRLGYLFMRQDQVADALTAFRANVDIYPQDANAHDSLGEGLARDGQVEAAIASYKRSLELDPKNANAVKMIEKLGTTGAR
jgi:CubicO group peptidase (beta-lactamase class C family)